MGNRSSTSNNQQQQGLVCPSETDLKDFQITKFIGAGTFGKVFVVSHKGLKKDYALKVLSKRKICRRKITDDVLSELELLQCLSHPFISSLWYTFQDDEQIYMITDLLLGGDLSYHLKNQGRFSESRAKLLICELGLALDYLHKQRIGHFDVKPANILLDEEGHAHLSDFGLAKRLKEGELATAFSGTRFYMAPEILLTALGRANGYDWRVDWWALGVCFYEMLRGRTPYEYPASFSSLQVLGIIYTRGVTMPGRWPSDMISFLRAIINPLPDVRIDAFEKFQAHSYMQRIQWMDVFDRKMVPIFSPKYGEHFNGSSSSRSYRATISLPLSAAHHKSTKHNRLFMNHFRTRDQQSNSTTLQTEPLPNKELDEEMLKLTSKFKKYNRFRCEIQIVEPRQTLSARPRIRTDTHSPKTTKNQPPQYARDNSTNRQPQPPPPPQSAATQLVHAEKMRKLFQQNNRDVNYSM